MQEEPKILKMKMAGRWSAQDLQTFLESIDGLYNFLFTLNIFEKTIKDYERFIMKFVEFSTRRGLRWWRRRYPQFFPYPSLTPAVRRPVQDIIGNLDVYVPFEQRLQLYSIEYKSPGSINFQGGGETIRELREWLERWYTKEGKRIRQLEVEEKELDIMERKMEILRKVGYNELEIRELMGFGEKKYKPINSLVKEGKLQTPTQFIKIVEWVPQGFNPAHHGTASPVDQWILLNHR